VTRWSLTARGLQQSYAGPASCGSVGSRDRESARRPRLAFGVVAGLLLMTAVARWGFLETVTVSSDSMAPTVCTGGIVLLETPPRGGVEVDDIVTFPSPVDGAPTIKRVVGLAGQTVAIEDARLVVDGAVVPEPYVDHASIDGVYYGPVTVPPDTVLVLGDHRENSVDSRTFGPVPLSDISGRGLVTLWSSCPS
jgi:signal peptidase I